MLLSRVYGSLEHARRGRPLAPVWARCAWLVLLLGCSGLSARPCKAQSFAATLDVAQGFVARAAPRTPYLFSVGVSPALDVGPIRVAVLLAPSYRNPRWDLALGGGVSVFIPIAVRQLGVRIATEAAYLPWQDSVRLSAGVIGEALGLIRLGVWPAYDLESERFEFMVSVGIDMVSWARFIAGTGGRR